MELYILHRRVRQLLEDRGCRIHASWVGEYVTALEMAGASVSILKLDGDFRRLLDRPCLTPVLRVGKPLAPPTAVAMSRAAPTKTARLDMAPDVRLTEGGGRIDSTLFRDLLLAARDAIEADADRLGRLDGAIGDGDHGVTMRMGWDAVAAAIQGLDDPTITSLCEAPADAFLDAVGASAGPLYATGFQRAGRPVAHRRDLDGRALTLWISVMAEGIAERGGARPGDKTMLDAWSPAAQATKDAQGDKTECLRAAAITAAAGAESTSAMVAARGRAAKLGARSRGHIDPGAASAAVILRAMSDQLGGSPFSRVRISERRCGSGSQLLSERRYTT